MKYVSAGRCRVGDTDKRDKIKYSSLSLWFYLCINRYYFYCDFALLNNLLFPRTVGKSEGTHLAKHLFTFVVFSKFSNIYNFLQNVYQCCHLPASLLPKV